MDGRGALRPIKEESTVSATVFGVDAVLGGGLLGSGLSVAGGCSLLGSAILGLVLAVLSSERLLENFVLSSVRSCMAAILRIRR